MVVVVNEGVIIGGHSANEGVIIGEHFANEGVIIDDRGQGWEIVIMIKIVRDSKRNTLSFIYGEEIKWDQEKEKGKDTMILVALPPLFLTSECSFP